MRKLVNTTSVLCGIVALISLVLGISVLTGHGYFVGLALFSMVKRGTVFGFIGNLLGIAVTSMGFGAMSFYGLKSTYNSEKKSAFIWGLIMSAICFVSFVASIIAHTFNIGDFFFLVLPLLYVFGIFKSE